MRPSKEKIHANASIFDPSFVYRQDGYELSYKIVGVFYSIATHLSSIFPQGGAPHPAEIHLGSGAACIFRT